MTMTVYTPNVKIHGKNGLLPLNKELQGQEADNMRQVDNSVIGMDLIQLTSETLHRLPPALRPD